MSPSENQLRAALSDGEGPKPDADAIIGKALVVKYERHRRRVRVAGVLGVAAVVGGVGVGLAATQGSDRSNAGSDYRAPAHPAAAGQASNGGAEYGSAELAPQNNTTVQGGAGGAGGVTATGTSTCPSKPVRYMLPGGGGTDQFGGRTSLFTEPVERLTVCAYSAESDVLQSTDVITGDDARSFVAKLDASTAKASATDCVTPINLEIVAVDTNGAALTPLTVVGTCQQAMVTNGTAVRYASISAFAPYVATPSSVTPPPSGMMSGSPVH
jgi:hypothetical protein